MKLRIDEILDEKNKTVGDFAHDARLAYGTALALKRGEVRRIDLDTLERVCEALGVTPNEVFSVETA